MSAGAVDAAGRWSRTVTLAPGANTLHIVATSAGVNPIQKEVVLTLMYDQQPPVVAIPLNLIAFVGQPFAYQIFATQLPQSYAASGLPEGLNVNGDTGMITGVPVSGGRYRVILSATNAMGTSVVTGYLAVALGYDAWRAAMFTADELADPAVSGGGADFDGDGYPNLVEYALGQSPSLASITGWPELVIVQDDWVYRFTRPTDRADVTFRVEISFDLYDWRAPQVSPGVVSEAEGVELWEARQPLTSGNVFFRLKVTKQ